MSPEAARALRDFEDSRPVDSARPELTLLVNRTDGPSEPAPERRTVVITGQRPVPRRREMVERAGPRPDRIAMWAFLLGIFLVIVATVTS